MFCQGRRVTEHFAANLCDNQMKIHSLDKQENLLKAERHIMMLLIKRESQFFPLLLLFFQIANARYMRNVTIFT